MPFASNKGVRIYWRLQGAADKPVLLLLNGIGTEQSLYDRVAPLLLPDFRLLRMDTRGHGASDVVVGDASLELLAQDVLAVMDAADVAQAHICGLSLGGMIAMQLAIMAPERISKLILACTSAKFDRDFWHNRITLVREQGIAAIAEMAVSKQFSAPFLARDTIYVDTIRRGIYAMASEGYAGCGAAIRDMDVFAHLPDMRLPTLVIGGEYDAATFFEGHGSLIAESIAGAQVQILPAGHLACLEAPDEFAMAITQFAA